MTKCVIALTAEGGKREYFAYDGSSGGYPYWTSSLSSAYFFNLEARPLLQRELDEILHGEGHTTNEGTKYPNRMLHSGLGLNNAKLEGRGIVEVLVVQLIAESSHPVEAKIQRPKAVKYEY